MNTQNYIIVFFGGYDFITAGRYDLSAKLKGDFLKLNFNILDNESLTEVQVSIYKSALSEKLIVLR